VATAQRIAIIVFPGVQPLDAVGPFEVFAGANQLLARTAYEVDLRATIAGPVIGESGLAVVANALGAGPIETLIVAGGNGVFAARNDSTLISWIAHQARTANRVASVCTGTFLLAEAGLLDGQTVTTHWARAARLAEEYPALTVDVDPIFVHQGRIWTSAGVTAGMDLALAMVAEDHGAEVAQTIARWLVMLRRRSGGQSQFAPAVWTRATDYQPLRAALDHIHTDPSADLSIDALAAATGLSSRHFSRLFHEHIGQTPGRYVDGMRVELARSLLEQTNDTVVVVAQKCGFGTAETMRRTFVRHVHVSPDQYRQHFALANSH
jgi:transcriptional regulator GlxA family with amidase domain